jgi:hypothetical protein
MKHCNGTRSCWPIENGKKLGRHITYVKKYIFNNKTCHIHRDIYASMMFFPPRHMALKWKTNNIKFTEKVMPLSILLSEIL